MAALTNQEVLIAFRNAFGRRPTKGELKYWVGKESTILRDKLRGTVGSSTSGVGTPTIFNNNDRSTLTLRAISVYL